MVETIEGENQAQALLMSGLLKNYSLFVFKHDVLKKEAQSN